MSLRASLSEPAREGGRSLAGWSQLTSPMLPSTAGVSYTLISNGMDAGVGLLRALNPIEGATSC